ncbi:terminase [Serratia silvae]|uniref:Terminase n=1 Tax=Serratia silvae TaxID=2824122 RepID=A0ABT0KHB2_9GAMM|nr:terminase [Serratia silvae]MCL1031415.1 terminase [Serratia silvae]
MARRKKIRSITADPRWRDMVIRYRYDWARASVELFGKIPSWQQEDIINAAQGTGSRTTVASGHGTGKSDITSIMILCFLMFYPEARVVIVANKIQQVMTGVFKYLKQNWKECVRREPWLQNYFVVTDTSFYEITSKGSWTVMAKGFRRGNEEALAGEHAKHLFYIIDEASGVSDKAFGVITGALTQDDNRLLLISQPTRPSGYFYDSHHKLARNKDNPNGDFTAITLNSEESPWVNAQFIRSKLLEYGGRDNPEYQIKVLGLFPKNANGFLLGRDECDRAARRKVRLHKGWGWIACCDVGNGRDKSILSIFRVSGSRLTRRVVPFKVLEMPGDCHPTKFAHAIFNECSQEKYPNITIAVDADGIGDATVRELESLGVPVVRINWGKPMHSREDKQRFANQRAFANIMARDAVKSGRMRLDANQATAEQASKIPVDINEMGQNVIMKKTVMRQKLNIKSPDRWDTFCFAMLVDYVAANDDTGFDRESLRVDALKYLDAFDDPEEGVA